MGVLDEVRRQRGAGRLDLRRGHATVEIAIDPQQQIDIVEGQADVRLDRPWLDGDMRVADAQRVCIERRGRKNGNEDAERGRAIWSTAACPHNRRGERLQDNAAAPPPC